ncbi:MAG: DegT/DnrJ/EryC1/StrS family aminotransferase [Actinophytocola sp.]|uniref:DegT/DnrJ/EryC1/StrS family aminotransferase n=1 Tax=Actinophytocola sp. TaxID=1872138 RepID=UPI003D6B1FF1
MINVFQPSLGEDELSAVREVFETSWVGRGAKVAEFENAFAARLGSSSDQVISTNSCTEATFLAMELLELAPGQEVVLPSVSFVGAANAVAARGARPVFCDVDERTLNPTVADIEAVLTPATAGVLLLHYGGRPGWIAEIAELCRERGIWLVEDAANAQASSVDGKACGTFGDIGVWSFDWGKIAVSIDGGILHARDPQVAARAEKLAYFGLEQTSGYAEAFRSHTRWWEFEISSFSRRSIMNDVQAAIGVVQLGRLDEFLARRADIGAAYAAGLADVPELLLPPELPAGHVGSHYIYAVQMPAEIRDQVAREMFDRGIYTTFRYPLLHKVKAYGSTVRLPRAERAAATTLCLPMHQALSDGDVEFVSNALAKAVDNNLDNNTAH